MVGFLETDDVSAEVETMMLCQRMRRTEAAVRQYAREWGGECLSSS
jgi:hypothetical protein